MRSFKVVPETLIVRQSKMMNDVGILEYDIFFDSSHVNCNVRRE